MSLRAHIPSSTAPQGWRWWPVATLAVAPACLSKEVLREYQPNK